MRLHSVLTEFHYIRLGNCLLGTPELSFSCMKSKYCERKYWKINIDWVPIFMFTRKQYFSNDLRMLTSTSPAKFCQQLYRSAKCACSSNTPAVPWTVAIRLTHAHCCVATATIKASKFPRQIWGRRPRPAGSLVLSLECSLWSSLRLHPSVRLTAIVLIILECWRTLSVCISLCLIVLSTSSGILLFPVG